MSDTTTIKIQKSTAKKLKDLRTTKLETYEEILERLLQKNLNTQKT